MKRLSVLVFTLLVAGSLTFAQAGGTTGKSDDKGKPASTDSEKSGKKGGKKGHKGGKKSKKNSGGTTTPPPK